MHTLVILCFLISVAFLGAMTRAPRFGPVGFADAAAAFGFLIAPCVMFVSLFEK